MKYINAMR